MNVLFYTEISDGYRPERNLQSKCKAILVYGQQCAGMPEQQPSVGCTLPYRGPSCLGGVLRTGIKSQHPTKYCKVSSLP